jgi:hypothetical protein
MSETEVNTWTSSDHGIVVSGMTKFRMDVNTVNTSNPTIPDFTKMLTGTLAFDENIPVIELKRIPIEDAKQAIHQYLKAHPGSRTSDLIIELALEPDIVIDALSQLRCEGKVEGKNVSHE